MILSALTGVASVMIGIYTSFALNLPTGATIVMVNFVFFILAFLFQHTVRKKRH